MLAREPSSNQHEKSTLHLRQVIKSDQTYVLGEGAMATCPAPS